MICKIFHPPETDCRAAFFVSVEVVQQDSRDQISINLGGSRRMLPWKIFVNTTSRMARKHLALLIVR